MTTLPSSLFLSSTIDESIIRVEVRILEDGIIENNVKEGTCLEVEDIHAIKQMNPDICIGALLDRVGPETENIFNMNFYQSNPNIESDECFHCNISCLSVFQE